MTLASGELVGPYQILGSIGAGGMGEVYRAHDPRLERDVAIKIMRTDFSDDSERRQRFEQEARAVSTLNHANILTVHDFGVDKGMAYLVTELLDGETLREVLSRGPLTSRRVREIAIDVARALASAHEKGIVHRDLKPENLFLCRDQRVKILDFGLARQERPSRPASQDASTMLETSAGTVLGTAGYMAPEQIRGERADARSDLFSLGVVLVEMCTGSNPFRRETAVESMHAILREDVPDLSRAPWHLDTTLARLLERLLTKDPRQRFGSAKDLALTLESLSLRSGRELAFESSAGTISIVRRLVWPLLLFLAGIPLFWLWSHRVVAVPESVIFEIQPLEANGRFSVYAETHNIALSPDGKRLAFVAQHEGEVNLYVRAVSELQAKRLEGTNGARSPFWSPDGREIAFFAQGKLHRMKAEGGPVQFVCNVQGSNTGSWGSQGVILFSQGFGPDDGLFQVDETGGQPTRVVTEGELPRWVDFLPDGKRFLFWDRIHDSMVGRVYLGDLSTEKYTRILEVSSQARYADPGWILFVQNNTLVAQRFDPDTGQLSGSPMPVASRVPHFFNGWSAFSVAGEHALAYQVNPPASPLIWVDRHGRETGQVGTPGHYVAVRLSPDNKTAVTTLSDPITAFSDVWLIDLIRGGVNRLSEEPYLEWSPSWSPDGTLIAYTASSPGPNFTITVRRVADGMLVASAPPHFGFYWVRGWNQMGLYLDRSNPNTGFDIWRWSMADEPTALLQTDFQEMLPSPSPDGRCLAFFTTASGFGEIELMFAGELMRRVRVSEGARSVVPRWRADSGELFYVSAEGWMTAVTVNWSPELELGPLERLFPVDLLNEDSIDVTADGQRFLLSAGKTYGALPVVMELNWLVGHVPD